MTESGWIALGFAAAVVTAWFTAAMAVAIIVTAVYAKGTLVAAKEDSRARTRPALAAHLERELLSHGAILLIIKNFGPSSATDVRVAFDPPAPSAEEVAAFPDSDTTKWLYQRFQAPVPNWAPGWSRSNVIRAGQDVLDSLTVTLSYFGPDGTPYEERFPLHPDHVLKEANTTPSKAENPIKLGQQEVSALHALVRTIPNSVGGRVARGEKTQSRDHAQTDRSPHSQQADLVFL